MYFYFITAALLVAGGVLAAASLIVAKKPNAQQLIDKLAPYQGWIGVVLFIWGIKDIMGSLGLLGTSFLFAIVYLSVALIELILGFMLGFGMITKYALSKNAAAEAKGQQIRAKLAPYQGTLGIIANVAAVVFLVVGFVL